MFNDTLMVSNLNISDQQASFQIPTRLSELEPIFRFNFKWTPDAEEGVVSFNVELNKKLYNDSMNQNSNKTYYFDNDGVCRFRHNDLNNFFIEGDLKLIDVLNANSENEKLTPANLRASITYGNSNDSLHYIKGNFKLKLNRN